MTKKGKIIRNGIEYSGGGGSASNIEYLTQAEYDALPESKLTNGVEYRITDAGSMGAAENVGYNNSKSGIEAVNVQDAIDKLDESLGGIEFSIDADGKGQYRVSGDSDWIPFLKSISDLYDFTNANIGVSVASIQCNIGDLIISINEQGTITSGADIFSEMYISYFYGGFGGYLRLGIATDTTVNQGVPGGNRMYHLISIPKKD